MGWGGLQLPTIQCDFEVLNRLPGWTRSTSLPPHTHTHLDNLFAVNSIPRVKEWFNGKVKRPKT